MNIFVGAEKRTVDALITEAVAGYFDFRFWLTLAQTLQEKENEIKILKGKLNAKSKRVYQESDQT